MQHHVNHFHACVFDHHQANSLGERLKADPEMHAAARAEHQRLSDAESSGIFDRCYVSRHTHRVLAAALRKVQSP